MYYLRAECKNPKCNHTVLLNEQGYGDRMQATVALLDMQRQEIMGSIVNAKWEPNEFQLGVKAADHAVPKDIQAVSRPISCGDGCDRMYLYGSADAFVEFERG